MRIQFNHMAAIAYRQYSIVFSRLANNVMRLSTGQRINSAADDPAGLAISERMRAQIRGMDMAARNVQTAQSMIQTADGALSNTHAILQRMNELTIQAATGTNDDDIDRRALNLEYQELLKELGDIAGKTDFNGRKLLDGSLADEDSAMVIQTGPNAGDTLKINIGAMSVAALNLSGTDISSIENATAAMDAVKSAINDVSYQRAYLGAMGSRLGFKLSYLQNASENLQAAESRIRDVDYAKEMSDYAKNQILLQAATAMLAQANSIPQSILSLLLPR